MIMHVKKASIMQVSLTKTANSPVLFLLLPRQENSLDLMNIWVNYQFYNYVHHISFLNSMKTSAEMLKKREREKETMNNFKV